MVETRIKTKSQLKLSIVIPTYNEAENIGNCLARLTLKFARMNIPYEILVMDSNSPDGTGKIVEKYVGSHGIRLITMRESTGIGTALKEGFSQVTGDIIVPFMADLSDNEEDLVRIYQKICEGYDAVYTNRFMKGGDVIHYPRLKLCVNRIFNIFTAVLFSISFTDLTSAFKGYRKTLLKKIKLKSDGFEILIELPLKAYLAGGAFTQIPVKWVGRKGGSSKFHWIQLGPRYLKVLVTLLKPRWFGP